MLTATCVAAGCGAGQPSYAGDWAREGVRVSLIKTGGDTSCSRYVELEMVDDLRFHSNPWVESLAVIVNVSGSLLEPAAPRTQKLVLAWQHTLLLLLGQRTLAWGGCSYTC